MGCTNSNPHSVPIITGSIPSTDSKKNPQQNPHDKAQKEDSKNKKEQNIKQCDVEYDPKQIRIKLQKSRSIPFLGIQPNKKVYLTINKYLKKIAVGKLNQADIRNFSNQIGQLENQSQQRLLQQISKAIVNDESIQTKRCMQKFKQMCSPFKIKVVNFFINAAAKLNHKKVVFVFGFSSEQIYFFCNSVVQKEKLKRNMEIENSRPQIECFDSLEYQDQIIYPFPTYLSQEEPLQLKLFCEYKFKDILMKCNEYGVILLISNAKDKSAYRTLSLMCQCFKGNIEQILLNLTIYHFKLDQQTVKKKVQSYNEIKKLKKNIKYFKLREGALNSVIYIPKSENDKYVSNMDNQIYGIVQNEIQLLTIKVLKSFETRKYKEFIENVNILEDYRSFKPNSANKLKNQNIDFMNVQLNHNFASIKEVFKQKFEQVLQAKQMDSHKIQQIKNQIGFLKQISDMRLNQYQDMTKKAKSYYNDILSDSTKLARKAIQTGLKNLKDCQDHQRALIKNLLQSKASLVDEMFSDKNNSKKILDIITINDKIDTVTQWKGTTEFKKAQQELQIVGVGNKYEQKTNRNITNVLKLYKQT